MFPGKGSGNDQKRCESHWFSRPEDDRILTGKYTAIPCFVGIMVLVVYLTFNVIGAGLQTLLEMGIDKLADIVDAAMTATHVNGAMTIFINSLPVPVGSRSRFLN